MSLRAEICRLRAPSIIAFFGLDRKCLSSERQSSVAQNSRPQSTSSPKRRFRSFAKSAVHPVAWAGLLHAFERNSAEPKAPPNQSVQVQPRNDHVPPKNRRRLGLDRKLPLQVLINFQRKEGQLPFVVGFEVEETISHNAFAGDAFNGSLFRHLVRSRLFAVPSHKAVPAGNEEKSNLNVVFHKKSPAFI